MAVDYEEGRRLLAEHEAALKKWSDAFSAFDPNAEKLERHMGLKKIWLKEWMFQNAEALLNPDPWRPLVDLEEKHKDGRIIDLWVRDYADSGFRIPGCKWGIPWPGAAPCWLELKPHPDALHDWEWQPIDFAPTHFRELKGPGHA